MKQRIQWTLETIETISVPEAIKSSVEFCPLCQKETQMMTPQTVATLSGVSEREIFRLLEAGKVHFIEARRIYACVSCYQELLKTDLRPTSVIEEQ
jgi:heterodisulfide reductase subunit C